MKYSIRDLWKYGLIFGVTGPLLGMVISTIFLFLLFGGWGDTWDFVPLAIMIGYLIYFVPAIFTGIVYGVLRKQKKIIVFILVPISAFIFSGCIYPILENLFYGVPVYYIGETHLYMGLIGSITAILLLCFFEIKERF